MFKRNDFLLIGAVILICIGILAFLKLTRQEGSKVVITVAGQAYDTLPLEVDTTYTVRGDNGEYNTFIIKDGYVDMTDASCPDKLCVHQKPIHYNHETIICLPDQLVLEIIGGEDSNVDMIAN